MQDFEAFVNGNAPNVQLGSAGDLDAVQGEFEQKLTLAWDEVDDEFDPVLVYLDKGIPVAWVDLENAVGHVVPTEG